MFNSILKFYFIVGMIFLNDSLLLKKIVKERFEDCFSHSMCVFGNHFDMKRLHHRRKYHDEIKK